MRLAAKIGKSLLQSLRSSKQRVRHKVAGERGAGVYTGLYLPPMLAAMMRWQMQQPLIWQELQHSVQEREQAAFGHSSGDA